MGGWGKLKVKSWKVKRKIGRVGGGVGVMGRVKGADGECGRVPGIRYLNYFMYMLRCNNNSTRDAIRFCVKARPFAGILKRPLCRRTKTPSGGKRLLTHS